MSDYDNSSEEHSRKIKEGIRRSREQKLEAKLAATAEAAEAAEAADALRTRTTEGLDPGSAALFSDDELAAEENSDEPAQALLDEKLRARTLEGIDPEIALLFSDEELAQYEAEENAKAAAERKKRALEDIRANLRQKARVAENLIAASVLRSEAEKKRLAELVSFRIDMPGNGAGHNGRNGIRIDGFLYAQGQVYTRPRAVFETLQSIFYKAWLQELTFSQLNQNQRGMSPQEVLARQIPRFEVPRQQDEAAA